MNTLIIFNDIINIAILESFQKITYFILISLFWNYSVYSVSLICLVIFFLYTCKHIDTLLSKKYLFWMYNIFNYVKNMNTIY